MYLDERRTLIARRAFSSYTLELDEIDIWPGPCERGGILQCVYFATSSQAWMMTKLKYALVACRNSTKVCRREVAPLARRLNFPFEKLELVFSYHPTQCLPSRKALRHDPCMHRFQFITVVGVFEGELRDDSRSTSVMKSDIKPC
jgi:hypothetical protein